MSGSISSSGLISGMDWETLISQLMSIERQPETRLQAKITALETEQTALQSLRTSLTSLRDIAQDFRLTSQFEEYATTTSDEDVATAEVTGSAPATGSYSIEVITHREKQSRRRSRWCRGIVSLPFYPTRRQKTFRKQPYQRRLLGTQVRHSP